MSNKEISTLRTRSKQNGERFRKVNLMSNYKAVSIQHAQIYLYSVKFDEEALPVTNRVHFQKMLIESRNQLTPLLGSNFCSNGRTLYSFKEPTFKEKTLSLQLDGFDIEATLKLVKEVHLDAFGSEGRKSIMFLNSCLKNVMRRIGFNEIGKSRKFFNMSNSKDLGDLLVFRGYLTGFETKIDRLVLKINPVNRIIRKQTALEFIASIYEANKTLSKDDKREVVRESLKGIAVMANYGTSRTWRIDDVVFDKSVTDVKIEEQDEILFEYYQRRYKITIENEKQPLLKCVDRLNNEVYLVPELCLMTGIPEDCDERRRMEISKETIEDADSKLKKINNLERMLSENGEESGWKTLGNAGIHVKQEFLQITAEEMECAQLMMGENPPKSNKFDSVERGKEACFQLFNKALFKNKVELNLLIIHFDFRRLEDVKNIFTSTSKNLILPLKIAEKNLGMFDNNALEALETCVENKKKNFNLILFVLPAKAKSKYPDIKKWCYSDQNHSVSSQVVLDSKLSNPKSTQTVCTKLLLQMAVKIGNILWVPQPPKSDSKIMIVAMAIAKVAESRNSVVAYNSTKDKLYSRFHSSYRYQSAEGSTSIIEKAGEIVLECVKSYVDYNLNQYPDVVIVLREGSTDAQTQVIFQNEIKDTLSSFQLSKKDMSLIYVSLDKKTTSRFFKKTNGMGMNPNTGTLIRDELVEKEGDFYLISNQNRMSAVVPVYYKILFNNTTEKQLVETGFLAQLFHGQCFNYMNWTGSVRVPAQLQYACKLARFKSEFFKGKEIHPNLQSTLYYL